MDEIRVHVVKYPDRANLVMRYLDPLTNRHISRSTRTTKKSEAVKIAAKWEAELQEGRYQKRSLATWEDFRLKYESEVLPGLASNTEVKVCSVFNTLERILNPGRVGSLTSSRLSFFVKQMRDDGLADATIAGYLAHLQAALAYAVDWGYLAKAPELPKLHRVKRTKVMKGRPITTEEFERMLAVVDDMPKRIEPDGAKHWKFFLRGLWLSGLRIGESLDLYWNRDDCHGGDCLEVCLTGRRPLLIIPAELEKGNEDRLLPMAPEFAEFLLAVPESDRSGHVFKFLNRRTGELAPIKINWASKIVSELGSKAGVVVNPKTRKCASAHDLRRSFGQRWAARVMPQILMQLMRHADISTTMKYYVGAEAETTADVLWEAVAGEESTLGNISGNSRPKIKLGN